MTTSVRTMLAVLLVLLADLQALILEPAVWVALTVIIMARDGGPSCPDCPGFDSSTKGKTMTRIETFAEHHRLKVTRDESNDQVIQGRRRQLYFDGPELCLMVLDGEPAIRSRWEELGGSLWMGDISPHPKTGKRVQDVKITGIPLENAQLAIRMCRVKPKRIMSDAQKAVLDRARSLSPIRPQRQRHSVESSADPGVMVRGEEASRNEERPV